MSSPELNPSRTFITQLLDSLRSLPPSSAALPAPAQAAGTSSEPSTAAASNPLDSAPEAAKKQLLTLHVLFPNEFLPALDLLDRRLVTRFRIRETRDEDAPPAPPPPREKRSTDADTSEGTVYYVRSAQPQRPTRFTSASSSSSSTSYDTLTTYQVLPRVWNCSCPAFAFAAFPSSSSTQYQSSISSLHTSTPSTSHSPEWTFGATALDLGIPPVCKHLLACVLAERCEGLFGGFVDERSVGVAEASGWAAGWGD
ncbi:hypothetical protein B0J11DRAFT_493511 [Dendryphion nanum]|uniref:SWIM-type domain-containing protein n=1 Tax=Dendryphion nanum TaxID=256645 RepID=A0A9P9DFF0_9PLEO|nr:hypothetical protein B0J11DRAFT_493511 [Dendryphion nanum]